MEVQVLSGALIFQERRNKMRKWKLDTGLILLPKIVTEDEVKEKLPIEDLRQVYFDCRRLVDVPLITRSAEIVRRVIKDSGIFKEDPVVVGTFSVPHKERNEVAVELRKNHLTPTAVPFDRLLELVKM